MTAPPEWKVISQLGAQVFRRLPESTDLAMVDIDGTGKVRSINGHAKRAWGWSEGIRVPNAVFIGLSESRRDGAGLLPLRVGGMTLIAVWTSATESWLVIGYRETDFEQSGVMSRFQSLIENLPIPVSLLDTDGNVTYANAEVERTTGFRNDEVCSRQFWLDVVHPEDRWKLMGALRRAIEGERALVGLRFLTKHRGPRLGEMHLFAAQVEDETTRIDCVVFDVTERSEVEDALFQSETLYRTFLEQSPVGMLHLDASGIVTFENHQLRQIIGEAPDDAWIGRSIFSIHGLESRILPLVRAMLESGLPFHGQRASFHARGTTQHLEIHGSPIRHPDGGIVGGVLMVEDRTLERRRENELQLRNRYSSAESELRTIALSNSSEEGFLQEAVRIFGETCRADRACILMNNAAGDCSTSRARWWRDGTEEPEPLVVLQNEHPILKDLVVRRDRLHVTGRSEEPVRSLLQLTGAAEAVWTPFFDDSQLGGFAHVERSPLSTDGAPIVWQDLELRLFDDLLRLFETLWTWKLAGNRYRDIVSTIDDCLFTFTFNEDGERRYLFITPQIKILTGYDKNEILAGHASVEWSDEIVYEADRVAVDAHDDILRTDKESRIVYRVQQRSGAIRWIREHASAQRDSMGDVIVSGILTDVTEQKTAEESLTEAKQQAESANELKSAFIATMSHEIRTPMGAVNGFSELLARELVDYEDQSGVRLPDQVTEFLQAIRDNSQRLLTLVNDLFDLSNLEVGAVQLRTAAVPLHEVILRSTSKTAVPLSEKGVDLRVDLDPADPIVDIDPQRLEQVLDVLLSNAVKFTAGGSVTVRSRLRKGGKAQVEVKDTGVGISEAYIERLFTPFLQEDNRLNRRYEGSGLGLSLVKRLLDLMGAEIEVESTKGEGSIFRILLPLYLRDEE